MLSVWYAQAVRGVLWDADVALRVEDDNDVVAFRLQRHTACVEFPGAILPGMISFLRRLALFIVPCLVFLLAVPYLPARVTHVEITSRVDVLDAKPFGDRGTYERITGRVYFSVPIANSHNQPIVDLANAVNLQNGEVEFSADFYCLKPRDPLTLALTVLILAAIGFAASFLPAHRASRLDPMTALRSE